MVQNSVLNLRKQYKNTYVNLSLQDGSMYSFGKNRLSCVQKGNWRERAVLLEIKCCNPGKDLQLIRSSNASAVHGLARLWVVLVLK